MSVLMEDTQRLLVVDIPELGEDLAESLERLSATVITQVALQAKTDAYELRVTRALARAANLGATLDELADAAGMSVARVVARLQSRPGLLDPGTQARLVSSATNVLRCGLEQASPVRRTVLSRIRDWLS
jgi:hypothetical protein